MSDENRLVWSDEEGDLRKKKNTTQEDVVESNLELHLKRVTSGKGRTAILISNLPANKKWCQKLAKKIKKFLGAGGAFKEDYIEVHGEQIDKVMDFLDKQYIKWKKIGG